MKTAKRIQLLLSPVLIATLALMLAVVSFGWYQAAFNDEIEATGDSVQITVEEPEGVEVNLITIGDYYTYSDNTFNVTNSNVVGYFGQTGEYDITSNENDKPYIVFYKIEVVSTTDENPFTSAYVDSLTIIKGAETLLEKEEYVQNNPQDGEVLTKFKIYFYTSTDGKALTNQSEDYSTLLNENTDIYMGIWFDDPVEENVFAYSDIKYYGATYRLGITFVPQIEE